MDHLIKEFFDQYQGDRYKRQIRQGIREGYLVGVVVDTLTGRTISQEISTRPWVDTDHTGMDTGKDEGHDECLI